MSNCQTPKNSSLRGLCQFSSRTINNMNWNSLCRYKINSIKISFNFNNFELNIIDTFQQWVILSLFLRTQNLCKNTGHSILAGPKSFNFALLHWLDESLYKVIRVNTVSQWRNIQLCCYSTITTIAQSVVRNVIATTVASFFSLSDKNKRKQWHRTGEIRCSSIHK